MPPSEPIGVADGLANEVNETTVKDVNLYSIIRYCEGYVGDFARRDVLADILIVVLASRISCDLIVV